MSERAEPRLRVFFALWPPSAVAGALHRVAAGIASQAGGRPMARDTLHQTLAFIGDIPAGRLAALEAIGAGLAGHPAGALSLDRVGYWRHNHIVWAAPSIPSAQLGQLAEDLGLSLGQAGFPVEKRPFRPHITLLRKVRQEPVLPALPRQDWPVRDFVLVSSELRPEGASYRVLKSWPLAAEPGAVPDASDPNQGAKP